MRKLKIGEYTITVWAEKVEAGWHGLASVAPPIPNTWAGGPDGNSLVSDGVESSDLRAEDAVMEEALTVLMKHRPDL